MTDESKRAMLVHKRKYLRKKVTESDTTLRNLANLNKLEKLKFLERCNDLSKDISALDDQIFELSLGGEFTDGDRDRELETSFNYKQKNSDYIVGVKQSLQDFESQSASAPRINLPITGNAHDSFKLKLPCVPFPQFGRCTNECLETFFLVMNL